MSQLARIKAMQAGALRRNISEEQKKAEDKYAHEKLKATPETVSTTSSIHPLNSEIGTPPPEKDVDMLKDLKSDVVGSSTSMLKMHG
jgi:hypothetical protein